MMQLSKEIRCRCLIIEDNIPAAELMKLYLKRHDVLSDIATDGQIGLKMFLDDPSMYHIVFLDIQMPVMDGYEVARRIRESGTENAAKILIVAMSGSYTTDVSANSNFNIFLKKPFEFRFLYGIINDFLQH